MWISCPKSSHIPSIQSIVTIWQKSYWAFFIFPCRVLWGSKPLRDPITKILWGSRCRDPHRIDACLLCSWRWCLLNIWFGSSVHRINLHCTFALRQTHFLDIVVIVNCLFFKLLVILIRTYTSQGQDQRVPVPHWSTGKTTKSKHKNVCRLTVRETKWPLLRENTEIRTKNIPKT